MWKYIGVKECNEFLLSLCLFDCRDEKKYIKTLYSITNNTDNYYKLHKLKKRNGKIRIVYEPSFLLKQIQRNILQNILKNKSISKYAKAYCPGVSLKDNALAHVNKKFILKLDIKDFFDSIYFWDIYNSCFSIEYFPKSVGMLLTYLCTYNSHLTQGTPTAAYISNLVLKDFDLELGNWCENRGINYTRYSDDLTFSGDFDPKEVIKYVRNRLKILGLKLNDDKTCFIGKSSRQCVTGIVVNDKPQVDNDYRKKIRQEIYYIKRYGLESHLNHIGYSGDSKSYLSKLYGRISYVLQINENDRIFMEYKSFIKCLMKG